MLSSRLSHKVKIKLRITKWCNVNLAYTTCKLRQTYALSASIIRGVASGTWTCIAIDLVETLVIKSTRKRGAVVDIWNNLNWTRKWQTTINRNIQFTFYVYVKLYVHDRCYAALRKLAHSFQFTAKCKLEIISITYPRHCNTGRTHYHKRTPLSVSIMHIVQKIKYLRRKSN